MSSFKAFIDVILNQFLTKPEVMLAIVVAIGYMLLRRSATKVISGAIKVAVGIMILQTGAGTLLGNFRPVISILKDSLGMDGYIIDPYAGMPAAMELLGEWSGLLGYSMILAFALNIILVRFTRFKAVFLTGHIMLIQSAVATAVFKFILGLNAMPTVLISAVTLGLYWTVFPHLLIKPTSAVVSGGKDLDREQFTVGHQQMFADWLAFKFGGIFGSKEDNVKNLKLPGWLSMFQDNVVATAIIMAIFTSAFLLLAGPEAIAKEAGDTNWLIYMLYFGLRFAVAITIILTGVRMFIGELVPAFKGISEKLLPGAVPAIDCPSVFPYAPKAVLLGFICTVIGQVLGIGLLQIAGAPIAIIPGFVPLFFDGGPVGVYANAAGGWKAIVVVCVLLGIVHIVGAALVIPITGFSGGWIGNFDWSTIWGGFFHILNLVAGG